MLIERKWSNKNKGEVCPYCRKPFKKKRQLINHIKDAHPGRLTRCICTMAQQLVGDGCDYCQPETVEKYYDDNAEA